MPVINRIPYRNFILTGHMGVGKTAIGRRIAQSLEIDFYDVENEIELQENQSAESIRETFGEARLRTLETRYIRELALVRRSIIAVNGSTVLDPTNLDALRATGPILCLTAALNEVLRRLHVAQGASFHNPATRSIAMGRLKRERKILDLDIPQLDTTGLTVEKATERSIQFWLQHADS